MWAVRGTGLRALSVMPPCVCACRRPATLSPTLSPLHHPCHCASSAWRYATAVARLSLPLPPYAHVHTDASCHPATALWAKGTYCCRHCHISPSTSLLMRMSSGVKKHGVNTLSCWPGILCPYQDLSRVRVYISLLCVLLQPSASPCHCLPFPAPVWPWWDMPTRYRTQTPVPVPPCSLWCDDAASPLLPALCTPRLPTSAAPCLQLSRCLPCPLGDNITSPCQRV
jgi:hypothetical protein